MNICRKTIKFISLNIKNLVFVVYSIEYKLKRICKSVFNVPTSLELGFVVANDIAACSEEHICKCYLKCASYLHSMSIRNVSSMVDVQSSSVVTILEFLTSIQYLEEY